MWRVIFEAHGCVIESRRVLSGDQAAVAVASMISELAGCVAHGDVFRVLDEAALPQSDGLLEPFND